jgi:GMP synthase PP-ATPase subunit
MTGEVFPFDLAFKARTATRIVNKVRGINLVAYEVTSQQPGTIERD